MVGGSLSRDRRTRRADTHAIDDIFASLEDGLVLNKENLPYLLLQKAREVGVSKYIDSRKFVHVCSALESELAEKNVD